jgi:hypothetical protein
MVLDIICNDVSNQLMCNKKCDILPNNINKIWDKGVCYNEVRKNNSGEIKLNNLKENKSN